MKISLDCRAVTSLDLAADDYLRLRVRHGTAWITLEGITDDFILSSSNPLEFEGPGRLVIEALEDDLIIRGKLSSRSGNSLEPLLETA